MSMSLARSQVARIALISAAALVGITASTAASASADGDTITNPRRPTHTCSDWESPSGYGTNCSDGSGYYCVLQGSHHHFCAAWDGSGGSANWWE